MLCSCARRPVRRSRPTSAACSHADRHAGFADYGRALMLPTKRKSVEPLAAHMDPWNASAQHQSLHHVVASSKWSDEEVLA
jgi:SRSO17 transposase